MNRVQRIVIIMEKLLHRPLQLFSLRSFSRQLKVSKSSISKDLSLIREVFEQEKMGTLETIPGAAGGIRFRSQQRPQEILLFLNNLSSTLSSRDRILPGGYLYMTDIIFNPHLCQTLGRIFAQLFSSTHPDFIITMETKGIPVALMTAHFFNAPLITIRRSRRVTEGSVLSINYVSGSSQKIQTMSLTRRALPAGARVLIMDDFMKAGGTARGMLDLMKEFEAEVLGLGVLVATEVPENKLVKEYLSLLILEHVLEEEGRVRMKANPVLKQYLNHTSRRDDDIEPV